MQSRLSTTKLPEFRRQWPLFEQEQRQGPFFEQEHSLFLSSKLSKQARPRVYDYCERFTRGRGGREHTPSTAFRHLPPNSARSGYATEGALFISPQLSTDAVSALRKVWVLIKLQALVYGGRCRKAMLGVWVLIKLQALVYDILPSTTAVFIYAIGTRNCQLTSSFLFMLEQ